MYRWDGVPSEVAFLVSKDFGRPPVFLRNTEASASEADMFDQLSCVLGCCINQAGCGGFMVLFKHEQSETHPS